jgi:pimeloyl-ACP methyl ester carboxylesterase
MAALDQRGLTGDGVILVGASVGANVVAVYAVNDSRVKDIVLLSAGDDYQGIQPMNAIRAYTGGILFVAYNGDDIAHESSMRFYSNATKASAKHEFYKNGLLHGTGALTQSDMKSKIEAWIISPS